MATNRARCLITLAVILILCLAVAPSRAQAHEKEAYGSEGTAFRQIAQVFTTGQDQVTGVVAEGLFSYPVITQNKNEPISVSTARNTLTQYGMAAQFGNIGLLAHNYLAGSRFFELTTGQRVYLFFGTGRVETFIVNRVLQYEALSPQNPYSDFRPAGSDKVISAAEMFNLVYGGAYHLTFQTCIEREGVSSWGRLFVIAEPVVPQHAGT
jgi:hypothetical protein